MAPSAYAQTQCSEVSESIIKTSNNVGQESMRKATGEILGFSSLNTVDDLSEMMTKAREAQIEWAKKPVKERASIIRKASAYIAKKCDELARTISDDNGKTRVDEESFWMLYMRTFKRIKKTWGYLCKDFPRSVAILDFGILIDDF